MAQNAINRRRAQQTTLSTLPALFYRSILFPCSPAPIYRPYHFTIFTIFYHLEAFLTLFLVFTIFINTKKVTVLRGD